MDSRARVAAWAALGFALGGLRAGADDADLKKELDALKHEVGQLRTQVDAAKTMPEGVGGMADESGWPKDLKLSGYLDIGANWNPGRPRNMASPGVANPSTPAGPNGGAEVANIVNPSPKNNAGRVFDNQATEFTLHSFEVDLEKAATKAGTAGFRADIAYGRDPQVYRSGGTTGGIGAPAADIIDLQQAFLTYKITDQLEIRAGKFVTMAGAEVIESKDNWNYSRSFLFGYAIPFTHTGVRAVWTPNEQASLTLGINNGWDTIADQNFGKTLELGGSYMFVNGNDFCLCYAGVIYYGPEQALTGTGVAPFATTEGNKRFLWDSVLSTPKLPVAGLSAMLNVDFGSEDSVVVNPLGTALEDAHWFGWALYAKYDLKEASPSFDKWSVAARIETLNDDDGFRFGMARNPGFDSMTVKDLTLTLEYQAADNLVTRLEYRHDQADRDFFYNEGDSVRNMHTFGAEAIYKF